MKDWTDKVVLIFYGLFGAGLGLLVYLFALGGWGFLLIGKADRWWNGPLALILCCATGGAVGMLSYWFNHPGEPAGQSMFFDSQATAMLFTKRLLVIAGAFLALYYIWQLAKSV